MRISKIVRWAGILCLLAGMALLATAHDIKGWVVPPEAKAVKSPLEPTPAVVAAGAALYADKCANCHGDKGKGDGPEAEMYDTPPADLSEPGMLAEMSDGEIFWKISKGRRPMPTFEKQLTDEQRWQLVHFVRTFAPKPEPAAAKPSKAAPAKKNGTKKP
jgi:mono/diheme cytochrome c family protein